MRSSGVLLQYWHKSRRALLLLLAALLLGNSAPTEYEVKLVYLYNFTKFVNWPESAFATANAPVNICVMGFQDNTKLGGLLNGKKAKARPIELKLLEKLPENDICHILFITNSFGRTQTQQIIKQIRTPTLLVGESADFAKHLGIIGFVTDDNRRIRIEINLNHAEANNLTIRAQLLEIARVIYRDNGES